MFLFQRTTFDMDEIIVLPINIMFHEEILRGSTKIYRIAGPRGAAVCPAADNLTSKLHDPLGNVGDVGNVTNVSPRLLLFVF